MKLHSKYSSKERSKNRKGTFYLFEGTNQPKRLLKIKKINEGFPS